MLNTFPTKSCVLTCTRHIWMELWLQNCSFCIVWSYNLDLGPQSLKFSEMLNTLVTSFVNWQSVISGTFWWSCGPKTAFFFAFGHAMNLTCDLKILEMMNTFRTSLLKWQNVTHCTFGRSYSSKTVFPPYLVTLSEVTLWFENWGRGPLQAENFGHFRERGVRTKEIPSQP